jgi:hypothetical protein
MTPTPERSPQSRLHVRGHAVRAGRFLWALLQMVIAMKVGMLIYHFKLDTVLAGTQFAALNVEYPVFGHWMMVAAMALAMSVFMRYYHKSTWQFCGEMTISMLVPAAVLTVPALHSLAVPTRAHTARAEGRRARGDARRFAPGAQVMAYRQETRGRDLSAHRGEGR